MVTQDPARNVELYCSLRLLQRLMINLLFIHTFLLIIRKNKPLLF